MMRRLLGIMRDDAALGLIPRVVCVEGDQVRAHAAALYGHGAATLTKPFALATLVRLVHSLAGGPDRDRRDDRDPPRAGGMQTGAV